MPVDAAFRAGQLVGFKGRLHRIVCHGDRAGTFDLVLHPDEMAGDRWRNVPADVLQPVAYGATEITDSRG